MFRLIAVLLVSSAAVAQTSTPPSPNDAKPQIGATPKSDPGVQAAIYDDNARKALPQLPPPPKGRATVIGGRIANLDPVRDQFVLNIFGGQKMKILFDERTQVFLNGERVSVHTLKLDQRASVETTQDGNSIFALKIHTLSNAPSGDCQGQVQSYNAAAGQMVVRCTLTEKPVTITVPSGIAVSRTGQGGGAASTADITQGALVAVTFQSDSAGHGIATKVDLLATPGSSFQFTGSVSFFDTQAGRLVVLDPRDNASYNIRFSPSNFPESSSLHVGSHVKVTATFDGSVYTATAIVAQ